MIVAFAFVCSPSFSEVPTYQHGQGCVGDSHIDKEQSKVSAFVEFKSIVYEHLKPTLASDAKQDKEITADNSVSTEAAPYDEWGKALA